MKEKLIKWAKQLTLLVRIVEKARDFRKKIFCFPRSVILYLCRFYLKLFPYERLQYYVGQLELELAISVDQRERLDVLQCKPICYLDVGARHGAPQYLLNYREFFDFYLCEPESKEAQRLREEGYFVIDRALSSEEGKRTLYVTGKAGSSSLLKPSDKTRAFRQDWMIEVIHTESVQTTTLDTLSQEMELSFDLVKLDTQGTEMDILEGMKKQHPLMIVTEVSCLEFYQGQKTFYDIANYLIPQGYLIWNFSIFPSVPINPSYKESVVRSSCGVPLHGDVMFMPDWTSSKGQSLILANDLKYAALMLIYGMEDILRFVLDELSLPHEAVIREALLRSTGRTRLVVKNKKPLVVT